MYIIDIQHNYNIHSKLKNVNGGILWKKIEFMNEKIYQQIKEKMCKNNDYFNETEFIKLYYYYKLNKKEIIIK